MRVLPLTIALSDDPDSALDPDTAAERAGDWILACGGNQPLGEEESDLLWRNSSAFASCSSRLHGTQHQHHGGGGSVGSLIAAAYSGLTTSTATGQDESLNRSIRLWSAECGHLVASIDR